MNLAWKHVTRRVSLSLSFLLLVMLLAACSGLGGSTASTSTPTPKPSTPTPTPIPTPAIELTTYTGTGFTIGYPATWTKQVSGTAVVFQDAQGLNTLTVVTGPNPEGTQSADTLCTATLTTLEQTGGVKDVQPVSLPATTTVGGEAWAQKGITGSATEKGVSVPGEVVVLADNHPAASPTTQAYEISYGGPSVTFSTVATPIFQAMLQSFKFTA